MPLYNPPFHLPDVDPSRNIYVSSDTSTAGAYPTVAAAIVAAEALAQSAVTDVYGVTIHLPSGFFNESVTIRKNVHLRGAGRTSTTVDTVTYRPTSTATGDAPTFCQIHNLQITNLNITNEINPSSGTFNIDSMFLESNGVVDGFGFYAKSCVSRAINIKGAWWVRFEHCELGLVGTSGITLLNNDDIGFRNCTLLSNILDTMDSSDPCAVWTLLDPLDPNSRNSNGSFRIDSTACFSYVTIRSTPLAPNYVDGSYNAVLITTGSFIGTIDLGSLCVAGIHGTGYFTLTIDPAAGSVSQTASIGYTPGDATKWLTNQYNLDSALDELASRVKTLETSGSGYVVYDQSDTYAGAASGTTVDATTAPAKDFSLQVVKNGAVTVWTVILEGSNDGGTTWSTIATHTNTTGDGVILWANGYTSSKFRTRCTGITGGTNVTAYVVATS